MNDDFVVMPYSWATAPGRTYNPSRHRLETAAGHHIAFWVDDLNPQKGVKVSREFYPKK